MQKLTGFLRLTRPANIVTAISDILAGAAIAGWASGNLEVSALVLLIFATIGLYGGGVVFNDVFDAALDKVERPERPIPSGLVSEKEGAIFGVVLLAGGIISASFVSFYPSGLLAFLIAVAALMYDKWGKHHILLGPLNMGLCRGLNLLLGMSLMPMAMLQYNYLALVPITYIAAITMISRGEVHGGRKNTMVAAIFLYSIVIGAILFVSFANGHAATASFFLVILAILIFPPLVKAMREPIGKNIGKAVKAGVLALIAMNAGWAAAFGDLVLALAVLMLLPLSILLAKAFAVT